MLVLINKLNFVFTAHTQVLRTPLNRIDNVSNFGAAKSTRAEIDQGPVVQ